MKYNGKNINKEIFVFRIKGKSMLCVNCSFLCLALHCWNENGLGSTKSPPQPRFSSKCSESELDSASLAPASMKNPPFRKNVFMHIEVWN